MAKGREEMSKKSNPKDKKTKVSELVNKIPNRFLLTIAAAKRARQLKEGAKSLSSTKELEGTERFIETALNEFYTENIYVEHEKSTKQDDAILDEISDYLDNDILEEEKSIEDGEDDKKDKSSKNKKKSKSLAA